MGNPETNPKCPKCGSPLPGDAPEGLCPRCLLALNLSPITEIADETAEPVGGVVSRPPPPPPAEIAPYFPQLEIIACLGRGGMGAVYKAKQKRIDRLVALKILSPERQGDVQFTERFEREARALARLNHPNIVTVYDFGVAAVEAGAPADATKFHYLLMEFVEGVTLRGLMQQRRLSPAEALAIVPKICDALQYAHGKGIVHRDIKPENILLATDGQVKIADFGIAKLLEPGTADSRLTGVREVVGTPHYMAPEQAATPGAVDHRADIFSLGVVIYEMLTSELPLGKFPPPSRKAQVDVRLDEVVLRALEKEPELRYQRVSQVKTDLETIASSDRSAASTNPGTSHPPARRKAKAWALYAGLTIAILGIAGGAWLLLQQNPTPITPDGCVAWWRGEGNADDAVGGNNGVVEDAVTFVPGRIGQAFEFNNRTSASSTDSNFRFNQAANLLPGSDRTSGVVINGSRSLDVYRAFTLSAWLCTTNDWTDGSFKAFLSKDVDHYHSGVQFLFRLGPDKRYVLWVGDGSTFDEFSSSSKYILGQWHHVAATFDSVAGKVALYVDGMLDASFATTQKCFSAVDFPVRIGRQYTTVYGFREYSFVGQVDEVRIYNRALAAEEIVAIYQAGDAGNATNPPPNPEVPSPPADLLYDDFDGPNVNTELWEVILPFPQSQVTQAGGSLTTTDRGEVIARDGFDVPIEITGRFRLNSRHENFSFKLRTDLSLNNVYRLYYEMTGARVIFSAGNNRLYIDELGPTNDGYPRLAEVPFAFVVGHSYDFRIIDTKTGLTVFIDGVNVASVATSFATGNRVTFDSRIFNGESTSLDFIRIRPLVPSPTAPLKQPQSSPPAHPQPHSIVPQRPPPSVNPGPAKTASLTDIVPSHSSQGGAGRTGAMPPASRASPPI